MTAHHVKKWTVHAHERLDQAVKFIGTRDLACQAGGNLGIWPYLLVKEYGFQRVYTFEPDLENLECLTANVAEVPQVTCIGTALGRSACVAGWLKDPKDRPGWHKIHPEGVNYGRKWVDMVAIDEMSLDKVDLLALDVEGYELEALMGAEQTLVRDHPVVIIEDLSKSRFKSFRRLSGTAYGHPPGAVQEWLTERGYWRVSCRKNDEIWVHDG